MFRAGVGTLLDVDASDVEIVSVSDVSSFRRRRLMQQSSGAVRVAFRVTASASQLSSISSQLLSASSSGALLSALQTAGLSSATGLSLQSVDAVYASESTRRAELAKGAIAGIVVGCSTFAILVFLWLRYDAKRRAARVQKNNAHQRGRPHGYQRGRPHGVHLPRVFGKIGHSAQRERPFFRGMVKPAAGLLDVIRADTASAYQRVRFFAHGMKLGDSHTYQEIPDT